MAKALSATMKPIIRRYISEFVYGAVDGTVTTFAVVAASAGAGLSSVVILVLGIANLIADGFSMGASAYLSAGAENDEHVVTSKKASPKIIGFATFAAFVVVGAMPILPYCLDVATGQNTPLSVLFLQSIILTAVTFLLIGYTKGRIGQGRIISSMVSTLSLGATAAALAYFAGDVLSHLLGV